jgi:hypothetical protein
VDPDRAGSAGFVGRLGVGGFGVGEGVSESDLNRFAYGISVRMGLGGGRFRVIVEADDDTGFELA